MRRGKCRRVGRAGNTHGAAAGGGGLSPATPSDPGRPALPTACPGPARHRCVASRGQSLARRAPRPLTLSGPLWTPRVALGFIVPAVIRGWLTWRLCPEGRVLVLVLVLTVMCLVSGTVLYSGTRGPGPCPQGPVPTRAAGRLEPQYGRDCAGRLRGLRAPGWCVGPGMLGPEGEQALALLHPPRWR